MEFSTLNIQDLQLEHTLDVNPATGSAAASVAVPLPEGRSGFGPSLSLHYSSGARNSVFGMGWSLSGTSFISLDTKKGLPRYDGSEEFAFNGGLSLVPQLVKNGQEWKPKSTENADYYIYYYRCTQEEAFTRFEKWVHKNSGAIHWRSRTRGNVVSVYGLDASGSTRIADPERPERVFSWLLETQFDDSGNAIQYTYKTEDNSGVDPRKAYETGRMKRFTAGGFAQKYLERIQYGNTKPLTPALQWDPGNKWLFEAVFDYGEYENRPYTQSTAKPGAVWAARQDPFSVYNPGFEIRSYRLCRRILVFHHFAELAATASLTGIFECGYNENAAGTTLQTISYTGVRRDLFSGQYSEKQLPALRFTYTQPEPARTFTGITRQTAENIPGGFNNSRTRLLDLFGEGLPGLLTESANTWYYKPNLGNGEFGRQETVIQKPAQDMGIYALGDFDQDGNLNLYTLQGRTAGYYEYDRDTEQWSGFRSFENIPQVGPARFIDLDADGFPDLLLERDDKMICYPFKGKEGFGKPYEFAKPHSAPGFAPMIGDNGALDYFLADMTGDGLPDQVCIRNGRVEYYPNLGHGRFGEAVLMENAPLIDFDTSFDAGRIRLYDLDGSGTADILYIGNGEIRYWHNVCGNSFTEGGRITGLPWIDNISSAIILDLAGNGMPSLVWSSSLAGAQQSPIQYLELTGGVIPRLLIALENGLGTKISIRYGHSGQHYLKAAREGRPWISKIPAHFTVADEKIITDHITHTRFVTSYIYRDGQYNGTERTFVSFGLIEQFDTQLYENASVTDDKEYVKPVCTRTWIHNGLFGWEQKRSAQYYAGDTQRPALPSPFFEQDEALSASDFECGLRALAGRVLRQEVYAADTNGTCAEHPYQVMQNAYCIRKLQPGTEERDSCYYVYQSESLSMVYEQQAADPKTAHTLVLAMGPYGDPEKQLSVSYARRSSISGRLPGQSRDYISALVHAYTHTDTADTYLAGTLYESRSFEINHLAHPQDGILDLQQLRPLFDGLISNALAFDKTLSEGGNSAARLVSWDRTYFWNTALNDVLPLGQTGSRLFAHHEESACFNDAFITAAYGSKVSPSMLSAADEGNYILKDNYWWQQSAVNFFRDNAGFNCLDRVERGPGDVTRYGYDPYFLNIIHITDALGNVQQGQIDYNLVEPWRMTDINGNTAETLYDALGMAIAVFSQGTVLDSPATLQLYGSGKTADYQRRNDETFANILADPALYLQQASSFLFYDLDCWTTENKPLRSIRITRENLRHDGKGNTENAAVFQLELEYQDGMGRVIQGKRKVEAGTAVKRGPGGMVELDPQGEPVLADSSERWLVSGHVVYNNKLQAVRQYEPFFSTIPDFENDEVLETYGVSGRNYYDPLGRVYRSDMPDNTFTEVFYSAWEVQSFDSNDTVDRSLYKTIREMLAPSDPERIAMEKALAHKETPAVVKMDPLGRELLSIQKNNDGTERKVWNTFDVNGNIASIKDARDLPAFSYRYDMLGRQVYEKSMDAGEKWSFHNNFDQTIHQWDSRNIHQRTRYDQQDRVTDVYVDGAGLDQYVERFVYGEDASVSQAADKNLLGQLVKHYDQAGWSELKVATPGGDPLLTERKLTLAYDAEPDWETPASVSMAAESYISEFSYDALGRCTEQKLPDDSTRRFLFNRGGGLQQLLFSTADGILSDEPVLRSASYNAKGLREHILLGNHTRISYTYDPLTFRMNRMRSVQTSGSPRVYQDIRYTYDPMGNLVYLNDEAQQPSAADPKVIGGLAVSAHCEYEYDALYQLVKATGRVHQALLKNDYADRSREPGLPADWAKGTRHIGLNNGAAVERYTRTYTYDLAGNIKSIQHAGASQNWTREIWTSANSNRSLPKKDLSDTDVSSPESHFDAAGNCTYMPHLRRIDWNYRNNIARVVVIDRSGTGKHNDEEYYVYAGDGVRIRKISCRLVDVPGNILEITEKIYLDGCEIKRITRGGTEQLLRITSHVGDDNNKLAQVHAWKKDTLSRETDDISKKKIHYQLHNHLGSAALELDEKGDIISYEEYFPYGGTAFIAGKSKRDIDLKDYRYSGKERDDFTGLYYFGYRYYAHWIGGWINPDPLGPEDSENLYMYVHNNPVNLVDPNGLETKKRGRVHYTATQQEQIAAYNRSLTPDQIAQFRREGRTILYYTPGRGVEAVTPDEARRRTEATLRSGGDVTIIQQPSAPSDPGDGNGGQGPANEGGGPGTEPAEGEPPIVLPGEQPPPPGSAGSTTTGADGGAPDSDGTGRSTDTSGASVNNGNGGGNQPGTNAGGGGGNTGDGNTPGNGESPGNGGQGQQGNGPGGGGNAEDGNGNGAIPGSGGTSGAGNRPGNGNGNGTTPARNNNPGNGGRPGANGRGNNSGNGSREGSERGSERGVPGGQEGGSENGQLGGEIGGDDRGSLDGHIDGSLNGVRGGTLLRGDGSNGETGETPGANAGNPGEGNPAGSEQGIQGAEGNNGDGNENAGGNGNNGNGANGGNGNNSGNGGQQSQGQQGQGQQGTPGDPRSNWMDTVTHYTGYLNLEFGGNQNGGEAGGIPGGMDLFGWRPPMWVRRTMQVLYVATTIITTVIPIGKAALAAKVAIQGALKVGLRATARRLLTAAAARIPTRAAMSAGLQRLRGSIGTGLSTIGGLFKRAPRSLPARTLNLDAGALTNLAAKSRFNSVVRAMRTEMRGANLVATPTALAESWNQALKHGNFIQRMRWRWNARGITQIAENPAAEFMVAASKKLGAEDLRIFGTAARMGIRTLTTDGTFVKTFYNKYKIVIDAIVYQPLRF